MWTFCSPLYLLRKEDPNLASGANCFSESITRAWPGTTALEEPWHTMMNLGEAAVVKEVTRRNKWKILVCCGFRPNPHVRKVLSRDFYQVDNGWDFHVGCGLHIVSLTQFFCFDDLADQIAYHWGLASAVLSWKGGRKIYYSFLWNKKCRSSCKMLLNSDTNMVSIVCVCVMKNLVNWNFEIGDDDDDEYCKDHIQRNKR